MKERAGSRVALLVGAGVLAALVGLAAIAGQSGRTAGPPLSPRSTSADGTRALTLLLERFGATASVGAAVATTGNQVALLLRDRLQTPLREELLAWVRSGGTLVVADPGSRLSQPTSGAVGGKDLSPGTCDLDFLADVGRLDLGDAASVPGSRVTLSTSAAAGSCFGDGSSAYVVRRSEGNGTVLSVGGAGTFTNALLGSADNSVFALEVLLVGGARNVAILDPNPPGQGDTKLVDLVPDRVVQAIGQIGIAFVVYAAFRARRLGRPVREQQTVPLAGSRLVDAVGRLQQRTGSSDRAVSVLRDDVLREVIERYGLPTDTPPEAVAEAVASRTGLDRDRVASALSPERLAVDQDDLVLIAHELDMLRQEVLDA